MASDAEWTAWGKEMQAKLDALKADQKRLAQALQQHAALLQGAARGQQGDKQPDAAEPFLMAQQAEQLQQGPQPADVLQQCQSPEPAEATQQPAAQVPARLSREEINAMAKAAAKARVPGSDAPWFDGECRLTRQCLQERCTAFIQLRNDPAADADAVAAARWQRTLARRAWQRVSNAKKLQWALSVQPAPGKDGALMCPASPHKAGILV